MSDKLPDNVASFVVMTESCPQTVQLYRQQPVLARSHHKDNAVRSIMTEFVTSETLYVA